MVFSSSLFLLYFFPLFLLIYYLADTKYKNTVIVISSIIFYMWGAPKFVIVILASIILDYYLSHLIYNAEGRRRRMLLVFSVCINVSILLFFKYSNFFVENVNQLLNSAKGRETSSQYALRLETLTSSAVLLFKFGSLRRAVRKSPYERCGYGLLASWYS